MTEEDKKEIGVATAVLHRFTEQRLPRLLAIKAKVDGGALLEDWDIAFLHEMLDGAEQVKPLVDHHPEYQEIYARATALYKEITDKALENEKAAD